MSQDGAVRLTLVILESDEFKKKSDMFIFVVSEYNCMAIIQFCRSLDEQLTYEY